MKRLLQWVILGASVLPAQSTDPAFINNEIANEISRLEQLLGPGPTDVTASMGPMPNGGNCTIQIIVRSQNDPSQYYTFTIPFVDDTRCKNYHLEQEPDGTIKVVPNSDPNAISPLDLSQLQDVLKYFNGQARTPGNTSEEISHAAAQLAPRAITTGPPEVLDLPLGPPLSAGTTVTGTNGCDPGQTYRIFRVDHFDNSATRFDGCPMQRTATIPIVAPGPLQAALTPDNSTLVVTSYNQGITFIDTATNTVSKTLFTNGNVFPSGIAIRNDGLAYVTSLIDANPAVLVLNTATKTILGTISIPAEYPHSVYFTPDGTTALVTCPITNYVFVIDVLTSTVSTAVPIGGPRDVAFNRNGTRAYITSTIFPSAVQVVDLATFQIVDSYPINGDPGYIQISRDGRYLTVMDLDSAKKWSIDLATRNVVTITSVVAGGGLTTLP
jgi:DNA-binding beta-propeller fold protein YncE